LGASAIDSSVSDPEPDLVYYERFNPSDPSTIALDTVIVEVGSGPSGSCGSSDWSTAFNWGDGNAANNGHLGGSYPELDNQVIPMSILYGSGALQVGIGIDLNSLGLSGVYSCVRITSPINWPDNDGSEVDSIEIRNP